MLDEIRRVSSSFSSVFQVRGTPFVLHAPLPLWLNYVSHSLIYILYFIFIYIYRVYPNQTLFISILILILNQTNKFEVQIIMAIIRSQTVTWATITLTLLISLQLCVCYRGKVGAKTEISDVKTNEEVQELGRFSVEEYNRSLRRQRRQRQYKMMSIGDSIGGELRFMEVVEAQTQVVSGLKYYLTISATQNGVSKMFESEVVVKPWVRSKDPELLNFGPSNYTTQYLSSCCN